ncbi:MAG: amidohydrolase family protein [Bacteroidales bacterium]|jgi:cytosine/adenosine deaminase-related metal-dependent hydrolase|nr:amidohydrolase family protein [Bacteroidales bacterium]
MLHLKNATYIHPESFKIKKTDIFVDERVNGKIYFTKPEADITQSIDCTGKLVTKAFANAHHHVYSALARGMHAPKKTPSNFSETLKYIWWVLDQNLDADMIRLSALSTAIACAKNGCTFVIDHHASPNHLIGSLEIIAKAFDEVGIGHLLCYEITDRYGEMSTWEGIEETDTYLSKHQGLVGLHASFTVENDTLENSISLAKKHKTGIHIHVAEDIADQEHCQKFHNKRVMERLLDAGVLDLKSNIFAHCIHLNLKERKILADSNSWVVANMDSNLNNRVGIFTGKNLGDKIMLGTDGMHSNMIKSAQSAFFTGQNYESIGWNDMYTRLRNVHKYLKVNKFKGDGDNNLIVMDYDSPTELTSSNFLGHFFFGLENRHIVHTIAQGKLIMENQKIKTVDEDAILKESRKFATYLWDKMAR